MQLIYDIQLKHMTIYIDEWQCIKLVLLGKIHVKTIKSSFQHGFWLADSITASQSEAKLGKLLLTNMDFNRVFHSEMGLWNKSHSLNKWKHPNIHWHEGC